MAFLLINNFYGQYTPNYTALNDCFFTNVHKATKQYFHTSIFFPPLFSPSISGNTSIMYPYHLWWEKHITFTWSRYTHTVYNCIQAVYALMLYTQAVYALFMYCKLNWMSACTYHFGWYEIMHLFDCSYTHFTIGSTHLLSNGYHCSWLQDITIHFACAGHWLLPCHTLGLLMHTHPHNVFYTCHRLRLISTHFV